MRNTKSYLTKALYLKAFFLFIRDETTVLGKKLSWELCIGKEGREQKQHQQPLPKQPLARESEQPLAEQLWLHPTTSSSCRAETFRWLNYFSLQHNLWALFDNGTWWINKRAVMGKCVLWVCFSSFYLSRFKDPLWECPHCIPNLSWNKVLALWEAVLHPYCFLLPPLIPISLTVTVMGKTLLRFN